MVSDVLMVVIEFLIVVVFFFLLIIEMKDVERKDVLDVKFWNVFVFDEFGEVWKLSFIVLLEKFWVVLKLSVLGLFLSMDCRLSSSRLVIVLLFVCVEVVVILFGGSWVISVFICFFGRLDSMILFLGKFRMILLFLLILIFFRFLMLLILMWFFCLKINLLFELSLIVLMDLFVWMIFKIIFIMIFSRCV